MSSNFRAVLVHPDSSLASTTSILKLPPVVRDRLRCSGLVRSGLVCQPFPGRQITNWQAKRSGCCPTNNDNHDGTTSEEEPVVWLRLPGDAIRRWHTWHTSFINSNYAAFCDYQIVFTHMKPTIEAEMNGAEELEPGDTDDC